MTKPSVEIWTDGSCYPNPGPGGWGVILIHEATNSRREIHGSDPDTTNNRMEMLAAIRGLEALKMPCIVKLHTDSQYLRNGFAKDWIKNWEQQGWLNSQGKPVANKDLWLELLILNEKHNVEWTWVKGHAGIKENECADKLAKQGRLEP